MSEKERLAEVAALPAELIVLLNDLDRKLDEADAIRKRIHATMNPGAPGMRKKSARRPQDIVSEVIQ